MDEITVLSANWNQAYNQAKGPIEQFDSGLDRNKAVTFAYAQIADTDPVVTWFPAAALGSTQVGEALQLVAWPLVSWMPANKEVYASFCIVNQEIHHNIVTGYRFYNQYGSQALETLHDAETDAKISTQLIESLKSYEKIKVSYRHCFRQAYNADPANGVTNDPEVLSVVFGNQEMVRQARDAAKLMTIHEQMMVQDRYFESAFGGGITLGQALRHTWVENWVTDLMGWGGPTIEGEYFSATQLEWTDVNQRLNYFEGIFKKITSVIREEPSLQRLLGLLSICPTKANIDAMLERQQKSDLANAGPRGLVWGYVAQIFDPEYSKLQPKPKDNNKQALDSITTRLANITLD